MRIIFILTALFISLGLNAQIDRSKAPKPSEATAFNLGESQQFTLDNGLKVIVVENAKSPYVSFNLIIDRDPIVQGKKVGYIRLAGDLIGTETSNRSKDELNSAVDQIGAGIYTSSTSVYASSLQKHKDKLMEMFADVVLNSTFSDDEFTAAITRLQSELQAAKENPSSISANVFNKITYGSFPYGEITTEETVAKVSLDDIKDYYQKYFIPNHSYLAITGNISLSEAKKLVEKHFASWEKGEINETELRKPGIQPGKTIALVNRPNAVQSNILVGHIAPLYTGSEDEIPARIMNTVLGGGAFRLFQNLREEHAYTYGSYSNLSSDEYVGEFLVSAEVRNDVTDSALMEIFYELNRLRTEEVPEEELTRAKNYVSGSFARSLENDQTKSRYFLNIDRYDLDDEYYNNYIKNIDAVSDEKVIEMANRYIKPDNALIVVVGNASEIAPALSNIAEVKYYDIYGNPTDPPMMDLPEGVTLETVMNDYVEAKGGEKALKKIKSMKIEYEGSMGENTVKTSTTWKKPNYLKETFSIVGMMNQTSKFDGERGIVMSPMGNQELEGKELDLKKIQSNFFYLANYDEYGINAELKGLEMMNGSPAYKVEMNYNDQKWIAFFDQESNMLIAETSFSETPQGTQSQTVTYSDFVEKSGVKFAQKQSINVMGRELSFQATNIEVNPKVSKKEFSIE